MLTLACCAAMAATYSEYLGPNRRPIWGFYPETTVLGRYLKTIVPRYSIWVSVPADHKVRAYDRTGVLLRTVKPDRTQPDWFETPLGLGYDGRTDEIVVADLAGRIVRLKAGSR